MNPVAQCLLRLSFGIANDKASDRFFEYSVLLLQGIIAANLGQSSNACVADNPMTC